jgi:hypothetical protein
MPVRPLEHTATRTSASVVESSRLFQFAASSLMPLSRAAATSRAIGISRLAHTRWRELGWRLRRRAAGVMVIAAGATHVGITTAAATPAGRLWLIIPAMAIAVGVALLLVSPHDRAEARKP